MSTSTTQAPVVTHDDITIQRLLEEIPVQAASALQTLAVQKRTPMRELVKAGLLKVANEITNPAGAPAHA